jgi:hypothetical protein
MRTAIAIGGRVLPADVERTETGFSARCELVIRGAARCYVGSAETYDGALLALRRDVLAALSE